MPVVRSRTTRPARSSSTTAASGTRSSTRTSTRTTAETPAPSSGGKHAPPLHHVTGMGSTTFAGGSVVPPAGTTNQGATSVGTRTSGGGYTRGKIDVDAKSYDASSFLLTVKTHHAAGYGTRAKGDDKITLVLQCRVQDGSQEGILNLSFLKNSEGCNNKSAYEGEHTFRISYDEVNKLLASYKPGLKLVAGANLAVAAKWATGHSWGGYNRGGVFEVPAPPATTSPVGSRVQGTTPAKRRAGAAADLPLDIEHKMPASVKNGAPAGIFGTEVKVSSRLETELKGELSSADELEYAVAKLYQLANDPAAADKALGKGWSIAPVTHWWQQTASGNVKVSSRMKKYADPDELVKAGLARNKTEATHLAALLKSVKMGDPLPLEDKYSGTAEELKESIIQRIRSNKIAEGIFNMKPGPGVLLGDISASSKKKPSGLIRKRIEYGYTLASKNVNRGKLEEWLRSDTSPFNPAGSALRTLIPKPAKNAATVAFTMDQERHRFTLKHQGGLEIDVSVDFVEVKHPKTGKIARKYMVEMEIDHQYINAPGSSSSSRVTGGTRPNSMQSFSSESQQKSWAQNLSGAAQLNGLPRFHEIEDLADKSIWQTPEQKETEKAIDKLFPILFPSGASASPQKGVAMATTLKLI